MALKGKPQTPIHIERRRLSNLGKNSNKYNGKVVFKDGQKLCSKCKEWKLLSEYDKRPGRINQVRPRCKSCETEYRSNHKDDIKYYQYKSGANKRGIEFNLTKEQFKTFWKVDCNYCGDSIPTIGLDRIDSNQGYSIDNVAPCCAICNVMKLALPREIFLEHCRKIIKHQATS